MTTNMELAFLCIALAITASGALIGWAIGNHAGYRDGYERGYRMGVAGEPPIRH